MAAAAQAQAAQAQQWQQQQQVAAAQQQAHQQQQLQGATVVAAQQQQQVVYPAFATLVGHSQHQGGGPVVGAAVGGVPTAQLSHPAPSSALVGAAQAALAFNAAGNPPPIAPNGSAMGGCGLVVPAAIFATSGAPPAPPAAAAIPLVAVVAAPPVPIRNKRRKAAAGAESEPRPNAVAAAAVSDGNNNDNHKNAPSRKATPSSRAAAAKKQKSSPSPEKPGLLLPSIASLTSGMCASAATLIQNAMDESNTCDIPPNDCDGRSSNADVGSFDGGGEGGGRGKPTTEQKKQTSRDRNREHARCTRLRKKAYVTKLKELVDGLHAERNEDARKRRVAVQHLAEIQELRRKVVHTFLDYHSKFEGDYNKWSLILEGGDGKNDEEEFSLKQPVTPYRSFRRSEIQKVRFWLEVVMYIELFAVSYSWQFHSLFTET